MEKRYRTAILVSLTALIFFMLNTGSSYAQRYDSQRRIKRYYANVYSETSVTKGILFGVTDSTIIMLDNKEYEKYKQRKDYKLTTVHYSNIEIIKLARTGRFIRSLGIGALAGAGIGFIIGKAGSKNVDPDSETTAEDKVFLGTGLGLAAGVAVGFVYGLLHKSYSIHKNAADFQNNKEAIANRALQNQ
jgi:hypothetical protein